MIAELEKNTQNEARETRAADVTANVEVNTNAGFLLIKRIFDIVASACALVVLAIPMLVVALLIKLESPGPAIYIQERLGKGGKPFRMYKFRSMCLDAEKNGPQWAKVGDDRCTRIGRVIRVWHIDELPQLINVLKGEMSVVGPRPERAYFYDEFEKEIPIASHHPATLSRFFPAYWFLVFAFDYLVLYYLNVLKSIVFLNL